MSVTRVLNGRAIPLVCGLLTLLMVARWWERKGFVPRVSDERAYLLQAEIFASGKWKLPARPLPEFFDDRSSRLERRRSAAHLVSVDRNVAQPQLFVELFFGGAGASRNARGSPNQR
ncbi:MAG: hypothetical protein ABJC63_00015 [Gemmatimonadales bacterium]